MRQSIDSESSKWYEVCNSEQIEQDSAIEVLVKDQVVAIFRTEDGLHAIDGICAHQGGPIAKGKVEHDCVTCPWHGWQYRLKDGFNAVTEKPMLKSFPIREVNDVIQVQIDL